MMKKHIAAFCLALGVISGIVSCNNDSDNPAPSSTNVVVFSYQNEVDGQPIQTDTLMYVNAAGNTYSVDLLKYYVSNVTLVNNNGTEFKAPNYELLDQGIPASFKFNVTNVPDGTYSGLRFYVGVDSTKNYSGANSGELDPMLGMYWDWFSGYVYFKHEGHFIDSTGTTEELHFHYGTLKGLITVDLPINMVVEKNVKRINLSFNLNKIYASPNMMDFNGSNFHQSTGPADVTWVQDLKQNFNGAFSITSIQ